MPKRGFRTAFHSWHHDESFLLYAIYALFLQFALKHVWLPMWDFILFLFPQQAIQMNTKQNTQNSFQYCMTLHWNVYTHIHVRSAYSLWKFKKTTTTKKNSSMCLYVVEMIFGLVLNVFEKAHVSIILNPQDYVLNKWI